MSRRRVGLLSMMADEQTETISNIEDQTLTFRPKTVSRAV